MRIIVLLAALTLVSQVAIAEGLTCDALRNRLDAKLQAKGVQIYTLEIVSADTPLSSSNPASGVTATVKAPKGKAVGTCAGGTRRLIYTRGY